VMQIAMSVAPISAEKTRIRWKAMMDLLPP
jgi:hypothetical protein